MPASRKQIAALPMRMDKKGRLWVLMVTSRESRRWVMPKGWTMDGKKPWAAAEIEALEEAGAKGEISHEKIGKFSYDKKLGDGSIVRCKVAVYPMIVTKLRRNWKERDQRKRKWFSPVSAAKRVNEAELSELLLSLPKKPKKLKALFAHVLETS